MRGYYPFHSDAAWRRSVLAGGLCDFVLLVIGHLAQLRITARRQVGYLGMTGSRTYDACTASWRTLW